MESESEVYSKVLAWATNPWISVAISICAKLNFAEILQSGSKSSKELATHTKTNPSKVYKLLRVSASVGIFNEKETDLWENNAASILLLEGKLRNLYLLLDSFHLPFLSNIESTIYTGDPLNFNGKQAYAYVKDNPQIFTIFNKSMKEFTESQIAHIMAKYDFSKCGTTVLDAGGGLGHFLVAILKKNTHMIGILLDVKEVIEKQSKEFVAQSGVADRITLVNGNFLESVPECDSIILKNVLHNWDATKTSIVLKNCHKVLKKNVSKLLIAEYVLNDLGINPLVPAALDFMMNILFNSHEKTKSEWNDVLSANGFKMEAVIPIVEGYSIIEATPI